MNRSDIVVVGSLNTDLVTTLDRFPGPGETVRAGTFQIDCGGKGANQAYAAGKLGAKVSMIGQVGNDDFGKEQIRNLQSVHVIADSILVDPEQPTGTAIIGVDKSGENRIMIVPGANGTFTSNLLEARKHVIENTRLLLLQLEIPMSTVECAVRIAKRNSVRVILDPAPYAALPDSLFSKIDFLTPNLSELGLLTHSALTDQSSMEQIVSAALSVRGRGIHCVVAKLGSKGALMVTGDIIHHWPAKPVQAVDSTAAGDCFNAAFAVELASGKSVLEAGAFAVAASAVSVTRKGAQSSMPDRPEVEDLLCR